MTKQYLGFLAAAALVVMAAAPAHAQADDKAPAQADDQAQPFSGAAPYLSLGGVYGVSENDSDLKTGTNEGHYGDLRDSGGYDIRAGYNFDKMFAAEIEWQSFLNFSTDATLAGTGNPSRDAPSVEARMLSFNGRISPLTGRFQPYGMFGMGWYNVQSDTTADSTHLSSFAVKFGLGVMAYITERTGVAIEAAYILPTTGTVGGGDAFAVIPITASIFFRFK